MSDHCCRRIAWPENEALQCLGVSARTLATQANTASWDRLRVEGLKRSGDADKSQCIYVVHASMFACRYSVYDVYRETLKGACVWAVVANGQIRVQGVTSPATKCRGREPHGNDLIVISQSRNHSLYTATSPHTSPQNKQTVICAPQ